MATKEKPKQDAFTPKSPLLKSVLDEIKEFDTYEGKQEAGKFGRKQKRRDD